MPRTERMMFRRPNWPDVDDVVAMCADAEVMRRFNDSAPLSPALVLAEEMPRLMTHHRRTDLGYWVARDYASGAFLGWFMMMPVDGSARTVRLGFGLRRQAWAQGYGAEGMLQLIVMARAAKMSTVIATTRGADRASRQAMEDAGLRRAPTDVGDSTGPSAVAERWAMALAVEDTQTATVLAVGAASSTVVAECPNDAAARDHSPALAQTHRDDADMDQALTILAALPGL